MDSDPVLKTSDPIPASIKKHFFCNKTPPNLSKDYDAIGFDADMCLVKYNVNSFYKLMLKLILEELRSECGYPSEINDYNFED